VQECKSPRVQECKSVRVQECKSVRVQESKSPRVQESRLPRAGSALVLLSFVLCLLYVTLSSVPFERGRPYLDDMSHKGHEASSHGNGNGNGNGTLVGVLDRSTGEPRSAIRDLRPQCLSGGE
jgi:hypothetical protein